jgi:hypothetical protein
MEIGIGKAHYTVINKGNFADNFYGRFEVFTAMTMKNAVFWDVTLCALVRTDVSEERTVSIIRVKKSAC